MGARRDDITGSERAEIAIEVLNPNRLQDTIPDLAQTYNLSRQALYDIAGKAKQILTTMIEPQPHGPQPKGQSIEVERDRLERGVLTLTEIGASQRGIVFGLSELLDTKVSLGWVNGQISQLEQEAAIANQQWQPSIGESLSGDEIYSNGQPNLLVVGNDSLYIYALTRQDNCEGETWAGVLSDMPEHPQFASDAGTGLGAGVKMAEIKVHQLDWDHLLRPLWGQATRLERQAYAAWQKVEERVILFEKATTPKRLQQHLDKWEKLNREAEEKMALYDTFYQIAVQVDHQFALIDLETGQLTETPTGLRALQSLGQQLQTWSGRIYHKLSANLQNWAPALFSYQVVLKPQLQLLQEQFGQSAIAALARIWQIEANQQRKPLSLLQQQPQQQLWNHWVDEAYHLLGEQLWTAYDTLSQLLSRSWRGSMLAECVNSLLRPVLDSRQQTDQGCLELFRFLHNVRPFARGKRAGHSPAELVGITLPDDPVSLLGLSPKVSI
jgi:hypothetical protein